MSSLKKALGLGAVVMFALAVTFGFAFAQDKEAVLKDRQATMKEQGKDLQNIKAYLEGKGEIAQAKQSAANLTQTTKKIPELFMEPVGRTRPATMSQSR